MACIFNLDTINLLYSCRTKFQFSNSQFSALAKINAIYYEGCHIIQDISDTLCKGFFPTPYHYAMGNPFLKSY